MTAPQLFEYFRTHLNDFLDTDIASCKPYQNQLVNDVALWNSSNPLGTLLHFDMIDDGTFIISRYETGVDYAQMIAKTVRTPLDGQHPVSGNRAWGIAPNPNDPGTYNFYTTGVDRVTGVFETIFNTWFDRLPILTSGFESADQLWTSLQDKMIAFINANGGLATKYNDRNEILRPKWADVDLFFRNQISLDELKRRIGC